MLLSYKTCRIILTLLGLTLRQRLTDTILLVIQITINIRLTQENVASSHSILYVRYLILNATI